MTEVELRGKFRQGTGMSGMWDKILCQRYIIKYFLGYMLKRKAIKHGDMAGKVTDQEVSRRNGPSRVFSYMSFVLFTSLSVVTSRHSVKAMYVLHVSLCGTQNMVR